MNGVIICGKDANTSDRLCSHIKAWCKKKMVDCKVDVVLSYKTLYKYVYLKKYNLIFIKTEMDGQSGIAMAKKLRADGYVADIVFLADNSENWRAGYECSALSYIVEPYDVNEVNRVLSVYLNKIMTLKQSVTIRSREGKRESIAYDEIEYIEIINKDMTINMTGDRKFYCRGNLSKIEKLLDDRFLRCHSSYIVNMDFIKSFKRYEFDLYNGTQIRISKNNYKNNVEKYTEHMEFNYNRGGKNLSTTEI